jgi:hypothetical protein
MRSLLILSLGLCGTFLMSPGWAAEAVPVITPPQPVKATSAITTVTPTPGASSSSGSTKPLNPKEMDANPSAMESHFVQFKPNFPLKPGSLNMFGYEREKVTKGYSIISPDRCVMAVTDVFYLPDNQQTYSRVYLYPVGDPPTLQDVLPPDKAAKLQEEKEQNQALYPGYMPKIHEDDVDPHAFWDRYSPEKQMAHRRVILEAGFATVQEWRVDVLHVVDWSMDGAYLLMIYRPGIHHLGVWKTIPVLYNRETEEVIRLTVLPQLVWDDLKKLFPELHIPANRVWDIRPLGWSAEEPQQFIVKLVMFEGQSEIPAGFWSYSIHTGVVRYLGDTIPQTAIARNGWLVSFVDPTAEGGPQTYEPGKKPPPKTEQLPRKRSWRDRVQFWKKQPGSPAPSQPPAGVQGTGSPGTHQGTPTPGASPTGEGSGNPGTDGSQSQAR